MDKVLSGENGNTGWEILNVRDLRTYFNTEDGVVKAVDGVDLTLNKGEVLGLVGESGCGKSVTSLSIMRLIDAPGEIVSGEVVFDGRDLLQLSESEMNHVRGNRISMIFQQPQSYLNPVFATGGQVGEVIDIHGGEGKKKTRARVLDLFRQVGIPDYEEKVKSYPHEMSGGQAQRVMIAMALAMKPEILIADEPTTALDVTIQAQILNLLRDLRTQLGASIILITHDLGVIAEMADRVAVMYAGRIVEQADVDELFARPLHPYTQGLIGAIPVVGRKTKKLDVIPGNVPNLLDLPPGCRFAPRCRKRVEYDLKICAIQEPQLKHSSGRAVQCWMYQSLGEHVAPVALP
jgi:oligopeptide/dipeptide ABC transporter ATP-binding protein